MSIGNDANGSRYALVNCDVFTGDGIEFDKALIINKSRIESLVNLSELETDILRLDLRGQSVAPGFIDLQVNGGGDILFNDFPTVDGLRRIVEAHRRFGTTNLFPTFITGSTDGMRQAADAVRFAVKDLSLAGVLGIHFEGPFIFAGKAGVHDKRFIRPPNDEDLYVIESIKGIPTLVTLAPEIVNPALVRRLADQGILVSLGHTDATYDVAIKAFAAGARCTTHIYNAMSALTSRTPGVVGAALDDRNSWAGIIVDGFHSDFVSARIAIRAKSPRKMFLVTDAMPPVGGEHSGFKLGLYDISVDHGRCVTPDGVLAGSALDMATAVRNCIQKIGMPKDEALRMASTYVAEFIGLQNQLGRISSGYRANLAIFNNQIAVSAVVVEGQFIEVSM